MTRTMPLRLMTLHLGHTFRTDGLTFISYSSKLAGFSRKTRLRRSYRDTSYKDVRCFTSFSFWRSFSARLKDTLFLGFLHQPLVLMSDQMGLDLGHGINSHSDNNQESGAAKIKREIQLIDQ